MCKILFCTILVLLLTNCASTVSSTKWPLEINTKPSGVKVEVTNKSGDTVFMGKTPAIMTLKSGGGFFSHERYSVKLSLEGKSDKIIPVGCIINEWYYGNILFGGLIGFLIVDPGTGAMYKLDRAYINENFTDSIADPATNNKIGTTTTIKNAYGFKVGDKIKIPHGLYDIEGRVVGIKRNSVVVEYNSNGKVKKEEFDNYLLVN